MPRRKLPNPLPQLPDVPAEALDLLEAYLTHFIDSSRHAEAVARTMKRIAPTESHEAHQTYWKNAASALRWVRGHLRTARKRHERGNHADAI